MLGSQASRSRRRSPATAIKRAPARVPAATSRAVAAPRAGTTLGTARRPLTLLIVFVLCGAGLSSRLVFWQVFQHAQMLQAVQARNAVQSTLPTLRGEIYDASGNLLAANGTLDIVSAAPSQVKNPYRTATLLAPLLGLNEISLQRSLTGNASYVPLARQVNSAVSDRINALGLPGISCTPQAVRMYPGHFTASQVIGYVDANGAGQYGIESQFNAALSGSASLRSVVKSVPGATVRQETGPATLGNGADIHLTLNGMIQSAVESELSAAVKKHRADGGTIIVMDPRTGAVLGMANSPTFDPNKYAQYANQGRSIVFVNPAVQNVYEPGSTFKIITMAAGLDTHAITPNTSFYDTGTWMVDGQALHNWNLLGNGVETMTQVLQHSANVGASFAASRIGTKNFYTYLRRFGIGRLTHVDLPGEVPGTVLQPGQKQWSDVTFYTNSFGQGLDATPLQMIHSVAAVANGGVMMQPQLVRSIVYRGHVVQVHPVSQGRVISRQTATSLTNMLVQSAIGGEAALGLVKGYNIAAKTGTANVASPYGGYITGDTIASIIGYAPAQHPRFIVLVKIDHPRDTPWGSTAAAPVLKDLLQDLFMLDHIAPSAHALNQ